MNKIFVLYLNVCHYVLNHVTSQSLLTCATQVPVRNHALMKAEKAETSAYCKYPGSEASAWTT